MKKTEINNSNMFIGFKRNYKKDFFKFPTSLIDFHLPKLTGSEFLVLAYILRRTLGFQKTEDYISISQFSKGAGSKNAGVGLSVVPVVKALKSLETKGFITTEKKFKSTTLIKLRLKDEEVDTNLISGADNNSEAIRLIMMFKTVCPHMVDNYARSKTQVKAMNNLLKTYGVSDLEKIIAELPRVLKIPYCPKVTSPLLLEQKFSDLYFFIKQKAEEEKGKILKWSF
jgi:DNA-binding MarR family transcriptional regulator